MKPTALILAEAMGQLLQQLVQAVVLQVEATKDLATAVENMAAPRKHVAVRDKNGEIMYVFDQQEI